jgi:hypothetical protein
MKTREERERVKVVSKWDEQREKDKVELDKQLGIKPSNEELDKVQQEIRKTLQSMLYHGYGIIAAELNILDLFKNYANQSTEKPTAIKQVREAFESIQMREDQFPDIHVDKEKYCGKCGKLL